MKERRTLTTGEVAKYCGVNFRTVIRWIKRGHLKAYQLPGRGDNRVEYDDFLEFLKEHRITLPEETARKHHITMPEEVVSGGRKVLIVDDDSRMASSIRRALETAGFETEMAYDGFRAGVLMGTFVPDVMTLDMQMPHLSGLDVIRYVRGSEVLKAIKILVVSALARDKLEEAIRVGADDVLEKPFSNDVLLEKISRLAGLQTGEGKSG